MIHAQYKSQHRPEHKMVSMTWLYFLCEGIW